MSRGALWHLGGMGDVYDALRLGASLRKAKTYDYLALYVRSAVQASLAKTARFKGTPIYDMVMECDFSWEAGAHSEAPKWDYFYEWRPYVAAVHRFGELLPTKDRPLYQASFDDMLSVFTNKLASLGMSVHELGCDSLDLPYTPVEELSVVYSRPPKRVIQRETEGEYLTISNGSDAQRGRRIEQTKEWSVKSWRSVVAMLRDQYPGLPILQVGKEGEPRIRGARSLLGLTTVEELLYVLSKSRLHLAVENGTVRLAKLAGARSVVVYGPTAPSLYGLEGDTPVSSKLCRPCFWTTGSWMTECPNGWKMACHSTIQPGEVFDAVEGVLEAAGPVYEAAGSLLAQC